jgi:hypothetical protein
MTFSFPLSAISFQLSAHRFPLSAFRLTARVCPPPVVSPVIIANENGFVEWPFEPREE